MMRHSHIKNQLYDYVQNSLGPSEMKKMKEHLSTCTECSKEYAIIASACDMVRPYNVAPSDERTEEFWNAFASQIEENIVREQRSVKSYSLSDRLKWFVMIHERAFQILAGSATVAAAALATVLVLRTGQPQSTQSQGEIQQTAADEIKQSDIQPVFDAERMHQYFQRSKVLLVGIANMPSDDDRQIDLSAEQRTSRQLIQEARYLENQPLDHRSAKLIDDLQKILIELANMKEHNDMPNVEILRSGIHRENLLFKIRLAETMFDSTQFKNVHQSQ